MSAVIVFDVFGTLVTYRGRRTNPYLRLVSKDGERLPFLTRNVPIDTFAGELGLSHLVPTIRRELDEEIGALRLFEDVTLTLRKIRAYGKKIAVCSNMASEYGEAVRSLLPGMDAYVFSYEMGAKKPEPAIYQAVCDSLGCRPKDIMFIGDSKRADYEGPRQFGMQARLIDRKGGQTIEELQSWKASK